MLLCVFVASSNLCCPKDTLNFAQCVTACASPRPTATSRPHEGLGLPQRWGGELYNRGGAAQQKCSRERCTGGQAGQGEAGA